VFKYADSNQLYFTCQIRLCQRQMGMCQDITPPNCGLNRPNRTRRATSRWHDPEVDVATHEMLVLDAEERHLIGSNPVCVPKITLPLIPLVLLTVAAVSVSVTMVAMGRKKEKTLYAP
ncbi:ZP domain-containing protein, partial [Trichostrongylus colubriformis]